MDTLPRVSIGAGEFPFYENQPNTNTPRKDVVDTVPLAQGPGSKLHADQVDGLNAVTATVAGPNVLVATDNSGLLPEGIIPVTSQNTIGQLLALLYGQ